MNPEVDQYLIDGCGRCEFYRTPRCKVNDWREELILLRSIAQESGLTEDFKWKQPCYTLNGHNIMLVTAFRDYACVAFFKGALLDDPQHVLVAPGESSQAGRQLRFTSVLEIKDQESIIRSYIREAIEVEKSGKRIEFKKQMEPIPEELIQKMKDDEAFKFAFNGLTPGRQRGYLLYFNQAKQSATRISRIEKCSPKIMLGKGLNDR